MKRLLDTVLDSLVEPAKAAKIYDYTHGHRVMRFSVMTFRHGEATARLLPRDPVDGETLLVLARNTAVGFDPDILVITFEAFVANSPRNPVTGKNWQEGEMEDVAKQHAGIERWWVSEALTLAAVNRAGDVGVRVVPFIEGHRKILWRDNAKMEERESITEDEDRAYAGGHMVDLLSRAMLSLTLNQGLLSSGLLPKHFGLDIEEAQVISDMAIAEMFSTGQTELGLLPPAMMPRADVILLAREGTERFRFIEERKKQMYGGHDADG